MLAKCSSIQLKPTSSAISWENSEVTSARPPIKQQMTTRTRFRAFKKMQTDVA